MIPTPSPDAAPAARPAPRPAAPEGPARYAPATVAEAAELLRQGAARREPLLFEGGGTDLGPDEPGACAVLETGRLARVVEYAPSDQVVVAEAGLTLAALQAVLGRERQRLALDPPLPERATLGGLLSANAFGPLRTRYGGPRDLVIGIAVVTAGGTLVRGGGKVVKNVAGFDLPRLFSGARGTLGLVAEVSFRLHPLPETSATLALPGLGADAAWELARALREAQLEPAAVAALCEGGLWDLGVRFEGFEAAVSAQARRALALAGRRGAALLAPGEAAAFWRRHDALRRRGALRAKLAALPSDLPRVAAGPLAGLLAAMEGGAAVWYPLLGLGFAGGEPSAEAPAAVARARAELVGWRGSLVVQACPASLREAADPWGPPPAALGVMRRLKERFDPDRRLAPGRFVGGI
ncbi:FAD-binding oxidoreductase [Anaeromyxobacter paludicola]|uniref:Glycolate oxidase n=1 Tax=Anaeromyxobacter paludicola TaxID=2918171 RepID=A0ABN6N9D3_9BACT|nr:FAD-binding oxidoreductase [Anaeromyxobacter paludicola]BDG08729.1 glycolate oxidase [Anaeromyxobacter paludicola]